jgi:hypothetical protein
MHEELKETGICFLRKQIDDNLIEELRNAVSISFVKHRDIQLMLNNEINSDGVALNVFNDDFAYIKLLEKLMKLGIIKDLENNFFESKFILNSKIKTKKNLSVSWLVRFITCMCISMLK